MITLEDLANPNMLNAFVVPEQEWATMTPEEKASVLFPDMTTKPLNEEERKHIKELFG